MDGSVRADEKGRPRAAANVAPPPPVAIPVTSLQSPVSTFVKDRGPPNAQSEPEQEELLSSAVAPAPLVTLLTDHMQLRTTAEADAEAARKKQRNVFITVL
ncbi:Two pore calcium channel protein 1 [Globisporangium polare]